MSGDVTLTDTSMYGVFRDSVVELRAIVGDGQPQGTVVTWRGVLVEFDEERNCWPIGTDAPLPNTIARVVTIIQDLNPASNHTSVTYELRGGVRPEPFPYSIDVRADKGKAHYVITFVFTLTAEDEENGDA
jgi:hypothetical protein